MSHFVTELAYRPSPRAGYYLLNSELAYDSDCIGMRVTAEIDFETNFVTGRKLLVVRRIVQDKMNAAAVIHDKLYASGIVSRAQADEVFREAMLVCGVARWRAWAAWAAVRTFGGQFYNEQAVPQQA